MFTFKKILAIIFIILLCEANLNNTSNSQENEEKTAMSQINKSVQDTDRYKNFSSMPSWIKLAIEDVKTKKVFNIIVESNGLANFVAKEKGFASRKTKQEIDAYHSFLETEYIEYVSKNKTWGIDLEKLKKDSPVLIFDNPMTFEQLDVKNEQELIEKYFDFDYRKGSGTLKGEYYEKYTLNPAFIALLIDLGYDVVRGCIVPNLNIYTTSFISRFKQSN